MKPGPPPFLLPKILRAPCFLSETGVRLQSGRELILENEGGQGEEVAFLCSQNRAPDPRSWGIELMGPIPTALSC